MKRKLKKYNLGSFVQGNGFGAATGLASGLLNIGADPNKPQSGVSALQGALSGAGSLAALGPWGAAAGAVIGGVGGLISAGKRKKAIAAADKKFNLDAADSVNANMTTINDNMYGDQYGQGGDTMSNQINIEKGELLVDPKSGKILQEYNGVNPLTGGLFQPHNKGKDPIHNFTFADEGKFVITKKAAKQYKDAVDNNDKIAQNTTLANIRNAKADIDGKFADGGDTINSKRFNNLLGAVPMGFGNPTLSGSTAPNSQPIVGKSIPTKLSGTGINANGLLDTLTQYAPALYNTGQGLFGNVKKQDYATPIANAYKNEILANMPKDIDLSSITNDILTNQAVANEDIRNNTSSAGVYRANRQNLAANTAKQLAGVRLQKQQIDNQNRGIKAGMYGNLAATEMQEKSRVRDYNLGIDEINNRRQGAKDNLLNAGLSQLQETYQNNKMNKNKAGLDKYSLQLLGQIFPNTKFYDMFDNDVINKLIGR